jgi:hypothetical protein
VPGEEGFIQMVEEKVPRKKGLGGAGHSAA